MDGDDGIARADGVCGCGVVWCVGFRLEPFLVCLNSVPRGGGQSPVVPSLALSVSSPLEG